MTDAAQPATTTLTPPAATDGENESGVGVEDADDVTTTATSSDEAASEDEQDSEDEQLDEEEDEESNQVSAKLPIRFARGGGREGGRR